MTHFFYGSYAWLFVIGLLLLTALATEIGYTAGRRDQWVHPEGAKGQVTAITAGALGVLALLMAFTFAMAVSRFDVRKQLVLNEANAIGSTYLRARLLPAPHKTEIADLLRDTPTSGSTSTAPPMIGRWRKRSRTPRASRCSSGRAPIFWPRNTPARIPWRSSSRR